MTLQTQPVQRLEQVPAFVEGSEAADFIEGVRKVVYDLVRRALVKLSYHRLCKADKESVQRFMGMVTGSQGHSPRA